MADSVNCSGCAALDVRLDLPDTPAVHPSRPEANTSPPEKSWLRMFKSAGLWLMDSLTRDRSEPRVWKRTTRGGTLLWHVYDPLTGQFFRTPSEPEVRAWLEARYLERSRQSAIARF